MANSNSLLQGVFSELSPHRFVPGWFWGLHQEKTAKAKDMILPPVVQEGSHFPASLSILGTNKISNFWQPDDFEVDHTVIEICISLITSEMASLRMLLSNLDFSSELPKSFVYIFPMWVSSIFLANLQDFLGALIRYWFLDTANIFPQCHLSCRLTVLSWNLYFWCSHTHQFSSYGLCCFGLG